MSSSLVCVFDIDTLLGLVMHGSHTAPFSSMGRRPDTMRFLHAFHHTAARMRARPCRRAPCRARPGAASCSVVDSRACAALTQASGGLVAFDLDTFLDLAARTRKWQCPHSMQPGSVQELAVDGFVQRVLACLQVRDSGLIRVASWFKGSRACKF